MDFEVKTMLNYRFIIPAVALAIALILAIGIVSLDLWDPSDDDDDDKVSNPLTKGEFEQGISIVVDENQYFFSGPVVGTNGEKDVPGHFWKVADDGTITGEHYNSGPEGTIQWWSSDAPDGELLFTVEVIIDTWSPTIAQEYADDGYVHYHELVDISTSNIHPSKVAWLRHTAVIDFTLDGGPHPELAHAVTSGVDHEFMPNNQMAFYNGESFMQGPSIDVDGGDFFFSGPALGPNGEKDVPGHYWNMAEDDTITGLHYNSGPGGASQWWSSDASDGDLLYTVEAIIDTWTPVKAEQYAADGYIHYHEFVNVTDGTVHPSMVVWLRHTAVATFSLDGGPHPELAHAVTPGVDLEFMPNNQMAFYNRESFMQGPSIDVDGGAYFFSGPALGPNGEKDVPGHYWNLAEDDTITGLHYNSGPGGASQWWSSDTPDGDLLYTVEVIIDTWTPVKAEQYAADGYIHYHEFVNVTDGTVHPSMVVWLRHTASATFNLDGGPHPELAHSVIPGIDLAFMPNHFMPYVGDEKFVHGIVLDVGGEDYYFSGPADGPSGEKDVPGHTWVQIDGMTAYGFHYNTGPNDAPQWWSSDADNGSLLFVVYAIIDEWTSEKAEEYAAMGYIHYHELVKVSDGMEHPTKVVWLKHYAVDSFNFDGGPHPEMAHQVMPGVDLDFMPNHFMPYVGDQEFVHGIVLDVGGEDYYFSGPDDGPSGEKDVPGHTWVQIDGMMVYGFHYNTGPNDASQWWSSDADNGSLLFVVYAIIDEWTQDKADEYAAMGYIHYHELVKVSDDMEHPTKVVWLKHYAVDSFNFDGGPHPEMAHQVTPGVDLDFMPNYNDPYMM